MTESLTPTAPPLESDDDADRPDRYISFQGINCFENACCVIDRALLHIQSGTKVPKYWEYFTRKIPEGYYQRTHTEDVLYLVCSNVFYLEELFEKFSDHEGLFHLERAEMECC